MGLTTSIVSDTIDSPLDEVFIAIAPIHLPLIFKGYGPLPAVMNTENQTGDWDAAGQARTVIFSDHSTAQETLTEYQRPTRFAYTVSRFTGILRFLIQSAAGEWLFTEIEGQTSISWSYRFFPASFIAFPFVVLIAKILWRGYMKQALNMAIAHVSGIAR